MRGLKLVLTHHFYFMLCIFHASKPRMHQCIIRVKKAKIKPGAHLFKLPCTRNYYHRHYSLYATIYLRWTSYLISSVWDQSTCKERIESDKIQNEKFLSTVWLEPTILQFEVWYSIDLDNLVWWKLYYLNHLYTHMHFRYQCIVINSRMMKKSVFCLVNVLFCVSYWNISILYK